MAVAVTMHPRKNSASSLRTMRRRCDWARSGITISGGLGTSFVANRMAMVSEKMLGRHPVTRLVGIACSEGRAITNTCSQSV